ncbi:putative conserved membrane protein [Synechococcus sp. BIOS-U3-1]|nr:putative conserved membrane protein [Synechococcus sp. BIOS-U3-1]
MFRCRSMEPIDPLLLSLFAVGLAANITVLVVSFRQIDRNEKQRLQINRMRGRLNRLLQQRS